MVSRKHHVAKSIIYRVYSTIVSVVVIWFFTRSWILSLGVGLAENIAKIFTYYFYERVWLHFALKNLDKLPNKMVYENATIKFVVDE